MGLQKHRQKKPFKALHVIGVKPPPPFAGAMPVSKSKGTAIAVAVPSTKLSLMIEIIKTSHSLMLEFDQSDLIPQSINLPVDDFSCPMNQAPTKIS